MNSSIQKNLESISDSDRKAIYDLFIMGTSVIQDQLLEDDKQTEELIQQGIDNISFETNESLRKGISNIKHVRGLK